MTKEKITKVCNRKADQAKEAKGIHRRHVEETRQPRGI